MKLAKISFAVFCMISILFAVHAYLNKTTWLFDQFLGIIIMFVLLLSYKKLRLNFYTFTFLAVALLIHNAGTFGFYNISPVPVQYDHMTHAVGLFAFTLAVHNILKHKNFTTIGLILITFLVSSGFGAFIEIWEFLGHLNRNSLFLNIFAGLTLDKTDMGREWANCMIDLLYNSLGCLAAIVIINIKNYFKAWSIL